MVFTVKATYKGETRKLSFPELRDSFPSFDQIYNQLYRIFPVSHNFYLSRLLFSPDSSKSRIMLARQVHTASDYQRCIATFDGRCYPNPLLRFSVFEEASKPADIPLISAPIAPISFSAVPPPPIIYSAPVAMDVDSSTPASTIQSALLPQQSGPQHKAVTPMPRNPPSRIEIESLISQFKNDLDAILARTFGPTSRTFPAIDATPPAPQPTIAPTIMCLYKYCQPCAKIFQGPWYSCEKCNVVVCPNCHNLQLGGACFVTSGPHVLKRETCPACPMDSHPSYITPFPPAAPQLQWAGPVSLPGSTAPPEPQSLVTVIERSNTPTPAPANPPQRSPVVHHGIICDSCDQTVQGVRHKCLDCPDYDLCGQCISLGEAERHNPFHEFFEILEPGRVVVHTVHSRSDPAPRSTPPAESRSTEPVVHNATCDLCDSRILGIRYKCLECPDFDTCSSCFDITTEQHPHHPFVKIRNVSDFLKSNTVPRPMHFATCNSCTKGIFGIRYKCMHPNCPDFDLCEACEAFPIPVHPTNHPLLKMRSQDTLVPTVYRAGQDFNPASEDLAIYGRQSSVNSGHRSDTRTIFDQPASPVINPPSPFFYRTTSSRSRSPSPIGRIPGGLPQPIFETYSDPQPRSRSPSPFFNSYQVSRAEHPDTEPLVTLSRPASRQQAHQEWFPVLDSSRQVQERAETSAQVWPPHPDVDHLIQDGLSAQSLIDLSSIPKQVESSSPSEVVDVQVLRHSLEAAFSRPAVEESPLTGAEELLSRPVAHETPQMVQANTVPVTSLAALLEGYSSALTSSISGSVSCSSDMEIKVPVKEVEDAPLMSDYIVDITVPDGQIFPPGAEFVKCWRMKNSGSRDWPESTELVFLAGENLARDKSVSPRVQVGALKSGAEIDIWTGELKAPEVPGRYVSYWRLRDDRGLFGVNIWLDITVVSTGNVEDSSDSSMSSSSVIVMPQTLNTETLSQSSRPATGSNAATTVTDDSISDAGSEVSSSVSVISVPASFDEDDWQDTRETAEETEEYVVLYDDHSSEEE